MTTNDDDILRAGRAVARFRRLCPGLTIVAKACTGNNKVVVRPGSSSCTDGKTIWIRPSIELGDDMTHERRKCGKRDNETKVPLCPACARDDRVLAVSYHEIAHIAFASFSKGGDERTRVWRRRAESLGRDPARVHAADRDGGHLAVAGLIDPHLPWAFNAYEDVRVNTLMRKERPGFINMTRAMTNDILENGIDDGAGGKVQWRDQPTHAQAGIAAYAMADETDGVWRPKLDEDAVGIVFEDEVVKRLSADVADSKDTYDTMELAFELVKRFRELGILPEPDDEDGEGDPDDEGEAGEGQSGDGEGGESGGESGEGSPTESRSGQGSGSGQNSATDPDDGARGPENGSGGTSGADGADDDASGPGGAQDGIYRRTVCRRGCKGPGRGGRP